MLIVGNSISPGNSRSIKATVLGKETAGVTAQGADTPQGGVQWVQEPPGLETPHTATTQVVTPRGSGQP